MRSHSRIVPKYRPWYLCDSGLCCSVQFLVKKTIQRPHMSFYFCFLLVTEQTNNTYTVGRIGKLRQGVAKQRLNELLKSLNTTLRMQTSLNEHTTTTVINPVRDKQKVTKRKHDNSDSNSKPKALLHNKRYFRPCQHVYKCQGSRESQTMIRVLGTGR